MSSEDLRDLFLAFAGTTESGQQRTTLPVSLLRKIAEQFSLSLMLFNLEDTDEVDFKGFLCLVHGQPAQPVPPGEGAIPMAISLTSKVLGVEPIDGAENSSSARKQSTPHQQLSNTKMKSFARRKLRSVVALESGSSSRGGKQGGASRSSADRAGSTETSNSSHPPPLRLRGDSIMAAFESSGTPLPLSSGVDDGSEHGSRSGAGGLETFLSGKKSNTKVGGGGGVTVGGSSPPDASIRMIRADIPPPATYPSFYLASIGGYPSSREDARLVPMPVQSQKFNLSANLNSVSAASSPNRTRQASVVHNPSMSSNQNLKPKPIAVNAASTFKALRRQELQFEDWRQKEIIALSGSGGGGNAALASQYGGAGFTSVTIPAPSPNRMSLGAPQSPSMGNERLDHAEVVRATTELLAYQQTVLDDILANGKLDPPSPECMPRRRSTYDHVASSVKQSLFPPKIGHKGYSIPEVEEIIQKERSTGDSWNHGKKNRQSGVRFVGQSKLPRRAASEADDPKLDISWRERSLLASTLNKNEASSPTITPDIAGGTTIVDRTNRGSTNTTATIPPSGVDRKVSSTLSNHGPSSQSHRHSSKSLSSPIEQQGRDRLSSGHSSPSLPPIPEAVFPDVEFPSSNSFSARYTKRELPRWKLAWKKPTTHPGWRDKYEHVGATPLPVLAALPECAISLEHKFMLRAKWREFAAVQVQQELQSVRFFHSALPMVALNTLNILERMKERETSTRVREAAASSPSRNSPNASPYPHAHYSTSSKAALQPASSPSPHRSVHQHATTHAPGPMKAIPSPSHGGMMPTSSSSFEPQQTPHGLRPIVAATAKDKLVKAQPVHTFQELQQGSPSRLENKSPPPPQRRAMHSPSSSIDKPTAEVVTTMMARKTSSQLLPPLVPITSSGTTTTSSVTRNAKSTDGPQQFREAPRSPSTMVGGGGGLVDAPRPSNVEKQQQQQQQMQQQISSINNNNNNMQSLTNATTHAGGTRKGSGGGGSGGGTPSMQSSIGTWPSTTTTVPPKCATEINTTAPVKRTNTHNVVLESRGSLGQPMGGMLPDMPSQFRPASGGGAGNARPPSGELRSGTPDTFLKRRPSSGDPSTNATMLQPMIRVLSADQHDPQRSHATPAVTAQSQIRSMDLDPD